MSSTQRPPPAEGKAPLAGRPPQEGQKPPQVVGVEVERKRLTVSDVPELADFGLAELPLRPSHARVELKGVATAYVNALRRTLMDEMPGHYLRVPPLTGPGQPGEAMPGFDTGRTTEEYMLPQFVAQRIGLIPLRPQLSKGDLALVLRFDAVNTGAAPITVYSGDLVPESGTLPDPPLFNPTFEIATVQPGKALHVGGIHIATGVGRDNAAACNACRASFAHLDVPQYADAEIRDEKGAAADLSGYKVSSMVADPRHHVLSAWFAATTPDPAGVRAVLADACANLATRLRLCEAALRGGEGAHGSQYSTAPQGNGLTEGVLVVQGETMSVGEVLRRTVVDREPDISYIACTVSQDRGLRVVARFAGDVTAVLLDAARVAIQTFNDIQRGISDAA